LKLLCSTNTVHVTPTSLDRDKRVIADLVANGRNVNQDLVRDGFAWWYRDYDKGDQLMESLENTARMGRQGLWNSAHPAAPWDFRKSKRERALYLHTVRKELFLIGGVGISAIFLCLIVLHVRRRAANQRHPLD
jgi:hypothetical protein